MNRDNNQIICSVCRKVEDRKFDKIPFNRIIYDLILKEKEQNSYENNNTLKNNVSIDYDICLNIGMIGPQSSGKTSLSSCIQNNRPIEKIIYKPTVNLDFFFKLCNIDGKKILVKIWDTAGTEKFNSIATGYLRGLHGCFIVFDISEIESFSKLNTWIQYYTDFNQYKEKIMIILGNKKDKNKERVVKYEVAKNFADSKNLPYFETSAMDMANVNEAFQEMIKTILKTKLSDEKKLNTKKLRKTKNRKIERNSKCSC